MGDESANQDDVDTGASTTWIPLRSINNLATLLSSTGRTKEAEKLYQEVGEAAGGRTKHLPWYC